MIFVLNDDDDDDGMTRLLYVYDMMRIMYAYYDMMKLLIEHAQIHHKYVEGE